MMENAFYFNCYFFCTTPTNRDLRQKAVYFPARTEFSMESLLRQHHIFFCIIANFYGVVTYPCGVIVIPEVIGVRAVSDAAIGDADADRCVTH